MMELLNWFAEDQRWAWLFVFLIVIGSQVEDWIKAWRGVVEECSYDDIDERLAKVERIVGVKDYK